MRRLRQRRSHAATLIPSMMLIAIALLLGPLVAVADANMIEKSTLVLGPIPYTPTVTADITRVLLRGKYDGASLIQASSSLTITRTVKGVVTNISVPVSASASSQPGGGMAVPKDGFVSFGTPGSDTFMPMDKLTITLTFQGNVPVSTSGGLWVNVDPKINNPMNVASFKVKSQTAAFDPMYTISNDLDPASFSPDTSFTIENLAFLGNLTTAQFNALDINSIAAGILPIGATPATPSTFTLVSSQLSSGTFAQAFLDPFPEPGTDLWDVAVGQFFDPTTDSLYGFIDGYQGVPEPPAVILLGSGLVLLGLLRVMAARRTARAAPLKMPHPIGWA
ncbi:MAG TPA: hypothetical protein VK433_01020 [Stellaceae bacterium]|nr:hypothetical protein [Stellaceae bacterium]